MQSNENPAPSRLPWLAAVAALILIALLVAPSTGGLAREQLSMLLTQPRTLIVLLKDLGVKEAPGVNLNPASEEPEGEGGSAPTDYSAQLLAALANQPGIDNNTDFVQHRLNRLRALTDRFPAHRSAILAHALRYATMGQIQVHRDGEVETYMTGKPSQYTATPSAPEAIAAFLHDAVEGEKSDPDNAYFPMMQAMGLFAARRDKEGLAAVERAGRMTRFEDYALEEAEANTQRLQNRFGQQTVVARAASMTAILFPHYAQLRAAARLTAYKAVQAEVAGHKEEGFAIRRAMMHCGSLMRAQSRSAIGSLVGIAIASIQTTKPGGEKNYAGLTETAWQALSDEERSRRRNDAYCAYLQKIGHPEEADWARKETLADTQAREILDLGMKQASPLSVITLNNLLNKWFVAMLLLANALEMLLLCGTMLLLKALKKDRETPPLLAVGLLCAVFFFVALQMEWAPAMAAMRQVTANLSSDGSSDGSSPDNESPNESSPVGQALSVLSASPMAIKVSACLFTLIAPFLTLTVLGFTQLVRRDQPNSVLAPGLQRGGAVIALLLAIGYLGVLIPIAHFEADTNQALDRLLQHEGKYYAQSLGKTWPP